MRHINRLATILFCSGVLGVAALAGCAGGGGSPTAVYPGTGFATGPRGTIADVVERSLPGVVNISSTKVIRTHQSLGPFFNDPFFRHFFGGHSPFYGVPRERRQRSLGSGVIIDDSGIILTNYHVVHRADDIRVTLWNGREVQARIVGGDPKTDLAVLRLQGELEPLQALAFGDSNDLRLGDVVLAIGNPFGVGKTVTMGIVSAKGRANMGIVDYEDFIQTDAAINPGNSGGALVSLGGQLVGINTAILSRSGGYQGIGFAIPSNMARAVMSSILKHGKVVRGWLGVASQTLSPELSRAMGYSGGDGVLVADVAEGSPAAESGIERGDIIIAIDGEVVRSPERLRNLAALKGPGTKVKLVFWRNGKQREVIVTLTQMSTTAGGVARLGSSAGVLGGLTVVGMSEAVRDKYQLPKQLVHGVVVEKVAPNTPSARSGIRPGDVIIEVNRRRVSSVGVFESLYGSAKGRLLLLVYRGGRTYYLVLDKSSH